MKILRNCRNCGESFYTKKSRLKIGRGIFCSRVCLGKFREGKPFYYPSRLIQKIELVECQCGCGEKINKYDSRNRERQ